MSNHWLGPLDPLTACAAGLGAWFTSRARSERVKRMGKGQR